MNDRMTSIVGQKMCGQCSGKHHGCTDIHDCFRILWEMKHMHKQCQWIPASVFPAHKKASLSPPIAYGALVLLCARINRRPYQTKCPAFTKMGGGYNSVLWQSFQSNNYSCSKFPRIYVSVSFVAGKIWSNVAQLLTAANVGWCVNQQTKLHTMFIPSSIPAMCCITTCV